LGILDFSKPFANETDASQTGVGADVLLQSGHPLAYVSKPLGVKTQGLSLEEGLLKYKNKIWVGGNTSMQLKLVQILHSSPIGGHSGVSATIKHIQNCLARVKEASYWVCAKLPNLPAQSVSGPGLLQPLATPSSWHTISLDFVEGLPSSHGYNCILVVVDLFSKYSHFLALKHPFRALSVANLFMQNIYKLHGLPSALVSDRDRIFTSQLWRELFRLAGVDLRLSSAYRPRSDGQTGKVTQCMEQ